MAQAFGVISQLEGAFKTKWRMYTNQYGNELVIVPFALMQGIRLKQYTISDDPFDCFIINTERHLSEENIASVALMMVESPTRWVEVFGHNAECIHDAIDYASVASGRQSKVGEGDPMTTWNETATFGDHLGGYVVSGGQGDCSRKVVLLISDSAALQRFSKMIGALCRK